MTQTPYIGTLDVEAHYDNFARKHDIDDYYARANFLIRYVEQARLRCIKRMIAATPEDTILEVGCGGGHVLQLFPQSQLTGLDVSGCMLEKARKNLQGYQVKLLKGEIHNLGLPDNTFDKIVCTEVLEHVESPEKILHEIARVLKPDGTAVITLPNDNLIHRIQKMIRFSGLARLPLFERIVWGGDEYHLHLWKVSEMRAMLSRHLTLLKQQSVPVSLMPIRYCFECTVF